MSAGAAPPEIVSRCGGARSRERRVARCELRPQRRRQATSRVNRWVASPGTARVAGLTICAIIQAVEQLVIEYRNTWGGRRKGAGRPRGSRTSTRIPHVKRPRVSRHRPHHITVRTTRGTWNLRSQRCYRPIADALAEVRKREGVRVIHFSVQHNHVHLIVEADSRRALSNAMRALLIRLARNLNALMGARGRRFEDRYHEHVLKTPSETRNALLYVIGNRAVHLARWGKTQRTGADEFSSLANDELIRPPESWLLTKGWLGPP
jgi:putative transposase